MKKTVLILSSVFALSLSATTNNVETQQVANKVVVSSTSVDNFSLVIDKENFAKHRKTTSNIAKHRKTTSNIAKHRKTTSNIAKHRKTTESI